MQRKVISGKAVAACVLAWMLLPGAARAQVQNPGFEVASMKPGVVIGNGATLSTRTVHSGKQALELDAGTTVQAQVEVAPLSKYKLSAWLKTSSGSDEIRLNPERISGIKPFAGRTPKTDLGVAQQPNEKIDWLLDARFGMFIHWGLYSGPGKGEWYMENSGMSPEKYRELAYPGSGNEYFAADAFNAGEWARIAEDAGMKYMCMVTMHHDGYALFDSKATGAFTSKQTHGRDFVKEYTEACRERGLKVGLYKTLINWRYPGYYDVSGEDCKPNKFGYTTDPGHKENARLMKEELYVQVKELLTNYGKIDLIFWDGGWLGQQGSDADGAYFWEPGKFLDPRNEWQVSPRFHDLDARTGRPLGLMGMVRAYQPDALVNPRSGWYGDFKSEEGGQAITGPVRSGEVWEKCMTMAPGWGYTPAHEDVTKVVSSEQVKRMLADCASRDMALLLNVAPDRHGRITRAEQEVLRQTGEWLKTAGEAIYGTRGGPWNPKDGEYGFAWKGRTIYVFLLDGFKGEHFVLPALNEGQEVARAYSVTDRQPVAFQLNAANETLLSGFKRAGKEVKILAVELNKEVMGDPGSSACIPDRVQTETTVQSPDGNHVFTVYQKQKAGNAARIYYRVSYKHKTVIEESELGVQVDNKLFEKAMGIPNDSCRSWCDDLELVATERGRVDETWKPLYGERSEYRDHYNELILKFRKGSDDGAGDGSHDKRRYYYMNLVIRAYNEGVAFRYAFPETSNGLFLHVAGEQTRFAFPAETLAYHEAWAQGPYALVKLENWKEESERPLTLKLANGLFVALSEAQLTDYARAKFALSDERNTLQVSLYGNVDVIAPYQTPWRVIMVAENAATLVENNYIILNLNDPCRIQDAGWIRPGKVIRVTRLNQADALKCVDFASARGLQYIHLDAGWYGKEFLVGSDATKVDSLKDLDIEALARYAATKNIGVFLYVNQRALERQLPAILPLYRKWGVKGIKFGFVQTGNQHWTTWLHDAVRACADHELMVDIHDEYRPTGFSRTYPNLLTQEGVRGNEEFPDATHDAILPFTRFLAGAADYTICYFDPRLKNTRAHQLALSVIYYSPLQFLYWYDTPDSYNGEPEVEFFDNVKSVWDDTRVLGGAIGEYIITARRSGDEWFIGAITNNDARAIAIPLHFLEENKRYTARIYADADAPGKEVAVYSADIVVPGDASPGETFTRESVMNFSLLSRGGVAIHVKAKQ